MTSGGGGGGGRPAGGGGGGDARGPGGGGGENSTPTVLIEAELPAHAGTGAVGAVVAITRARAARSRGNGWGQPEQLTIQLDVLDSDVQFVCPCVRFGVELLGGGKVGGINEKSHGVRVGLPFCAVRIVGVTKVSVPEFVGKDTPFFNGG